MKSVHSNDIPILSATGHLVSVHNDMIVNNSDIIATILHAISV